MRSRSRDSGGIRERREPAIVWRERQGTEAHRRSLRFVGAFDRAKANVNASIYVLPGSSFQANRTSFDAELVSEIAVIPMLEIPIENAKTHLLEFRDAGQLKIYSYPDRPNDYPSDDSDLIANALKLIAQQGQPILDWLEREFGNDLSHVIKAVREA